MMKYSVEALCAAIQTALCGQSMTVMEVCGTHTHSIRRWGLRQLLQPGLRLLSGPGCPVCVTDGRDLGRAIALAERPDTLLCSFGDMLRVPYGGKRLLDTAGARLCLSPLEALSLAAENPGKQVVWFGVGFETTTAHSAALLEAAQQAGQRNLSLYCAHKTMPAALRALLRENQGIDALLCPGHVAAITGAELFRFLPEEMGLPAAVAGFEPSDILLGLLALAKMRRAGKPGLVNAYPRAVDAQGNATARGLVGRYFEPCTAVWRGLGEIPDSGLRLRGAYADWDAARRFPMSPPHIPDPPGCRCGDILTGRAQPGDCRLYGGRCTPESPVGACMVSAEGACAAAYAYGE